MGTLERSFRRFGLNQAPARSQSWTYFLHESCSMTSNFDSVASYIAIFKDTIITLKNPSYIPMQACLKRKIEHKTYIGPMLQLNRSYSCGVTSVDNS
mmetsp:Transcript_37663/g.100128  ORF Transcript_37663/g.100128 Transcript_37663/m.100128 type:complete len:97 (-) Transcript_37663:73-363(-)